MKLHRFIGSFDFSRDFIVIKDPSVANQIRRVLKLAVGESVMLCDGNMNDARAEISSFGSYTVNLKIVERFENHAEPKVRVRLYCALLKRENFEWVAQKCTEVGVLELVPLVTGRTVKLGYRPERIQKIMHEAAEQGGRGRVPMLHDTVSFAEALKEVDPEYSFFLDQSGQKFFQNYFQIRGKEIFSAQSSAPTSDVGASSGCAQRFLFPESLVSPFSLFIGPEGGWTSEEVQEARSAGIHLVSLGSRILRAETAAVIAVDQFIRFFDLGRVH